MSIIVLAAVLANIIVTPYMVYGPLQFFPTLATIDLLCAIHLRCSFPAHGGFIVWLHYTIVYIGAQGFFAILIVDYLYQDPDIRTLTSGP
jgi:hypothetical protein